MAGHKCLAKGVCIRYNTADAGSLWACQTSTVAGPLELVDASSWALEEVNLDALLGCAGTARVVLEVVRLLKSGAVDARLRELTWLIRGLDAAGIQALLVRLSLLAPRAAHVISVYVTRLYCMGLEQGISVDATLGASMLAPVGTIHMNAFDVVVRPEGTVFSLRMTRMGMRRFGLLVLCQRASADTRTTGYALVSLDSDSVADGPLPMLYPGMIVAASAVLVDPVFVCSPQQLLTVQQVLLC
jgi:hypothetical protein